MGGRWNSAGKPIIYAALSYAGAMLEVLVHTNIARIPPSHRCVIADVPEDVAYTRYSPDDLPVGWDLAESSVAQQIGDNWIQQKQTALLLVPSVVARMEFNVLINPAHQDASRIKVSEPMVVQWDERLFR